MLAPIQRRGINASTTRLRQYEPRMIRSAVSSVVAAMLAMVVEVVMVVIVGEWWWKR